MASYEINMSKIVSSFDTGIRQCADWAAKNIIETENKSLAAENKLGAADAASLSKIAQYDIKVTVFHVATAFAIAYLAMAYFGYIGVIHAAVKIGICLFVREVANQSIAKDNTWTAAFKNFFTAPSSFFTRLQMDPEWKPDYLQADTPWGKISLIKNPTLSWDKQFALFKEAILG